VRLRIHEPATSLTDLALGLVAAMLALLLIGPGGQAAGRRRAIRQAGATLLGATSAASLAGAALHGVATPGSRPREALWRLSLASIGIASLAGWWLAAALAMRGVPARVVRAVSGAIHLAYLGLVVRASLPFRAAVAIYLPSAAAVLVALGLRLRDPSERRASAIGIASLGLTIIAATIQVRRIAIHPRWFDHNALYHVVQGFSVALLYAAIRGFAPPSRGPRRQPSTRRRTGPRDAQEDRA
jgi:hypothetical protein